MKYEIKIIDSIGFISLEDCVQIFILQQDEINGRRGAISQVDGQGMLEYQDLDYNVAPEGPKRIKPFMKLPADIFIALTKFMVDYAKTNNIKTEEENFMAGKMKSMELHLEDMRKLVFKNDGI